MANLKCNRTATREAQEHQWKRQSACVCEFPEMSR